MSKKYKIGIVGAGFVGSACEIGFSSLPNTEVFVHDKFKPSESLDTVVENANIIFVCVPTPMTEDGSCDTSVVEETVLNIAAKAKKQKTIVIKSTVVPGTTQRLHQMLGSRHCVMFNPEFLTEANFIHDFIHQDRIILGVPSINNAQQVSDELLLFYDHFIAHQPAGKAKMRCVEANVAEMVKYATNCFLATKVIFFNEIYQICQAANIKYDQVAALAKLDPRIGTSHMQVPCGGDFGFSKSCFPKDLNALTAFSHELGVDPLVLETVWSKNLMVRQNHDWNGLPQVTGQYKKDI